MLLAVVVPSGVEPPSDTVTVDPAGAVPVKVTVGSVLGFTDGRLNGCGRRRRRGSRRRQRDIVEIPLRGILSGREFQDSTTASSSNGVGVLCVAKHRLVGEGKQRLSIPDRREVVRARAFVLQPEAQRVGLAGRRRDGLAYGAVRADRAHAGRVRAAALAIRIDHDLRPRWLEP